MRATVCIAAYLIRKHTDFCQSLFVLELGSIVREDELCWLTNHAIAPRSTEPANPQTQNARLGLKRTLGIIHRNGEG